MAEEREKRKIADRRPHAQRLKRVHADTAREDEEQHEVSLESIRERMSGLQEKHLQLRQILRKPEKVQGAKLSLEFDEARLNNSAGEHLPENAWNDGLFETILEQAHSSESESIGAGRLLYQIGRKTIFILSNRRVGIQFIPTASGQAQESYYCVLSVKPPSDKIVVSKDNIPFFLPLRELERTHLQLSATSFIDHLDNHLQAFVSRRAQIQGLKQNHGQSIKDHYESLSHNVVRFSLDDLNCKADVELSFDELESEYPTRATVMVWSLAQSGRRSAARRGARSFQPCGPSPQVISRRVAKAEELLISRLLPEAYADLIKEIHEASTAVEVM